MISNYDDAVRVMDENEDIFDGLTKAEWFYEWLADGNTHILIALQGMALKAHRYGNRDHRFQRTISGDNRHKRYLCFARGAVE